MSDLIVPDFPKFHLPASEWPEIVPKFDYTRLRALARRLNIRGRSKMTHTDLAAAVVDALGEANPADHQAEIDRFYQGWMESKPSNFCYKTTLRTEFGLTDRWIDALPVYREVDNPHYRVASSGKLYYRAMVDEFIELNRAEYDELQAAREKRAAKRKSG